MGVVVKIEVAAFHGYASGGDGQCTAMLMSPTLSQCGLADFDSIAPAHRL